MIGVVVYITLEVGACLNTNYTGKIYAIDATWRCSGIDLRQ
jgi:hypothetical protein